MKKTGFVAIVGRPNVGKSTLLNALLGEKIAIISKKPQTTRNRITGILTRGETQFVFLDTPGMHNPKTKLGDFMVKSVSSAIGDVDAAILVVEAGTKPHAIELGLIEKFKRMDMPALLVINKTDKVRANYYSFYTGQKWGMPQNYDLCINSAKLTDDEIVELICSYIGLKTK